MKTYFRDDERKTISSMWGYCNNWKSHLRVAERLGYTFRSDYGFAVDTINKVFTISDVVCYYKVLNKECVTHNDIRGYQKINGAWQYLRLQGYVTSDKTLNSLKVKK